MDFDHFSVALLIARPDAPLLSAEEEAALQDAHLNHLATLHEAGQLAAAGPLQGGPGSGYRGLSILTVPVEQATALAQADPAVIAGRFSVQVMPWMVPAGAVLFGQALFPHSAAQARGGA
ncbi:MAG: YciI family protein [Streptosporangiaceae bacterium]|jgi:uncharacterized protein YciI